MSPTPAQLAEADQYLAKTAGELDELVESYAKASRGEDRTKSLARLTDGTKSDGTHISHESHVQKLATLLATAIDRLARA